MTTESHSLLTLLLQKISRTLALNHSNPTMFSRISIILIIALAGVLGYAQNGKNPYKLRSKIITANDTIHCFLTNDEGFGDEIKYKLDREKNSSVYRINADHVLKIDQGARKYQKIKYKGRSMLIKSLVQGSINLYEYNRVSKSSSHTVENMAQPGAFVTRSSVDLSKPKYYLEKDGEIFYLGKGNKKRTLRKALTGNPEVTEMIDDLDNSLIRFRLRNIVKKYNYGLEEKN